ncbi:MAG TPA: Uma2 family endonuclease [Acidobacteriota bacterium]|nr:Uma2 family endonuclease [Acidobacteriota bacterium]
MSTSAVEIPSNLLSRIKRTAPGIDLSAPGTRHQTVVLKVAASLLRHVEARKLGRVLHAPCDIILSKETVVQPDICFIKRNRSGIIFDRYLRGIPDLVIEITPHIQQTSVSIPLKRILSRFGVREYWEINHERKTAEILLWSELGYVSIGRFGRSDRMSSPLFPGFTLPLAGIFGKRP